MKLELNDLKPKEFSLELSEKPGKNYVLKKFSLASQVWLFERFGKDGAEGIFKNQNIPAISEIAYYLMKDKADFQSLESFREAIVTQQDKINLITALLATVGISQPVLDKLVEESKAGNAQSPSQPTGAASTTP